MDNKKPIHFLVLKIVGFIGVCVAITGIVLTIKGFGDFESDNFMIGGFVSVFGIFVGLSGLVAGFRPEITKMITKSNRYIQQENKEDLSDIASTSAEIAKDAVTTTTRAIKEGLSGENVYCKHCGASIDADSKFCNKCGKEL